MPLGVAYLGVPPIEDALKHRAIQTFAIGRISLPRKALRKQAENVALGRLGNAGLAKRVAVEDLLSLALSGYEVRGRGQQRRALARAARQEDSEAYRGQPHQHVQPH